MENLEFDEKKKYYKLRDTGTSFYDSAQGQGLVAHRINALESTDNVMEAIRDRRILLIEDTDEIKEKIKAQNEELKVVASNEKLANAAAKAALDETPAQKGARIKAENAAQKKLEAARAEYKKLFSEEAGEELSLAEIETAINTEKQKQEDAALKLTNLRAEYKQVFEADAEEALTPDELTLAIQEKKVEKDKPAGTTGLENL